MLHKTSKLKLNFQDFTSPVVSIQHWILKLSQWEEKFLVPLQSTSTRPIAVGSTTGGKQFKRIS